MDKNLVAQLVATLAKTDWPAEEKTTDRGWEAYKVGLEKVDSFRHDPKPLGSALHTFQTGGSRPYALAGAAYALLAAARQGDGSYDAAGLEQAMAWLENAQATVPDNPNINFIEALIYVRNGRFNDARLVLDYLLEQAPKNIYILRTESEFWYAQGEIDQAIPWLERSMEEAQTVPERMRLRHQMADYHYEAKQFESALPIYREISRLDTQNHSLWHKISLCHWHLEDFEAAHEANKRALAIKDFAAGRKMEEALKQKLGTGMLGRWFGR